MQHCVRGLGSICPTQGGTLIDFLSGSATFICQGLLSVFDPTIECIMLLERIPLCDGHWWDVFLGSLRELSQELFWASIVPCIFQALKWLGDHTSLRLSQSLGASKFSLKNKYNEPLLNEKSHVDWECWLQLPKLIESWWHARHHAYHVIFINLLVLFWGG